MTRTMGWVRAGATVAAVLLTVSACSDDKSATPTTTTVAETVQQFLDRVQTDCPSYQPAFDTFYSEHPDPTAADYAEFLPSQIDGLQAMASCLEASGPPASITADAAAVIAAMGTVIDDLQKALDAATAGDLDGTNKWVGQMHDVDVAKIDESISVITGKANG